MSEVIDFKQARLDRKAKQIGNAVYEAYETQRAIDAGVPEHIIELANGVRALNLDFHRRNPDYSGDAA